METGILTISMLEIDNISDFHEMGPISGNISKDISKTFLEIFPEIDHIGRDRSAVNPGQLYDYGFPVSSDFGSAGVRKPSKSMDFRPPRRRLLY